MQVYHPSGLFLGKIKLNGLIGVTMNEWLEAIIGLSKQTIAEDTYNEPTAGQF